MINASDIMLEQLSAAVDPRSKDAHADNGKTRIFISWSGNRSRALATALHRWLPIVLQNTQPWMSSADIRSGERWGTEVATQLENCDFGLLCITADNLNSPWILFEAGALSKSVEKGRVVPVVLDLDVSDITFPLGQFQARKADEQSIKALVRDINKSSSIKLEEPNLEAALDALWPDLSKRISDIPPSTDKRAAKRSTEDILEELVSTVRRLDARVCEFATKQSGPEQPPDEDPRRYLSMLTDGKFRFPHLETIADAIWPTYPDLARLIGDIIRDVESGDLEAADRKVRIVQVQAAALSGTHSKPWNFVSFAKKGIS